MTRRGTGHAVAVARGLSSAPRAELKYRLRRRKGVTPASLPMHTKGLHYAWVTLGIAIAMRLVSSVERIGDVP